MPANPPDNMPRITPNVFYDDLAAALEWLDKAFGFETRMSMPGPDGGIMHAEMQVADSVIMMSPASDNVHWKSPQSLSGSVTLGLYIYVDDVDEHEARARSAGAEIVSDLEDMFWGDRTYVAADPEGHRWTFAQHTRDVAPSDIQPPA
jgi:PhnB protein